MTWWDVALLNKVSGYSQNTPNLLDLTQGGSNFTLSQISLLNSPHFHVKIDSYDGFTAWGVKLLTPSLAYSVANYACATVPSTTTAATTPNTCYTPDTTKNTDGIDPGGSNNVTIAYSYISVGDDNVAVTASNKGGGCTSGDNGYCASTNTKIAHNWFFYGHGMSVGRRHGGRGQRSESLGSIDRRQGQQQRRRAENQILRRQRRQRFQRATRKSASRTRNSRSGLTRTTARRPRRLCCPTSTTSASAGSTWSANREPNTQEARSRSMAIVPPTRSAI